MDGWMFPPHYSPYCTGGRELRSKVPGPSDVVDSGWLIVIMDVCMLLGTSNAVSSTSTSFDTKRYLTRIKGIFRFTVDCIRYLSFNGTK